MLASIAGQQMPAVGRTWPAVAPQVHLLLAAGGLRRVLGIEADGDDFEILAGVERDGFQTAGQPVEDLGAQHGAAVVDRRQNHRLAALEERGERDVASGFILEHEVERDLLVEPLIDADALQRAGKRGLQIGVLHLRLLPRVPVAGRAARRRRTQRARQAQRHAAHR